MIDTERIGVTLWAIWSGYRNAIKFEHEHTDPYLDTEEARTTADTALRDYHLGLMTFAFLHYSIVVSNRIYTRFRITNMP
jgi:Ca2+/Na+ antiporter